MNKSEGADRALPTPVISKLFRIASYFPLTTLATNIARTELFLWPLPPGQLNPTYFLPGGLLTSEARQTA